MDREEFIDRTVTRLVDRNSVILAAPRRTGKTSVAYEILRRLREQEDTYTAEVDLSSLGSARELAEKLTAACLANAPGLRMLASARESLTRLLRMPEVRAKVHEYEIAFGITADVREQPPEKVLEQALALPEAMGAKDGRRFVVLFDEFQAAIDLGGQSLLARMRAVLQLQQRTAFLFLGSQATLMAQLFGAHTQPFFRFATWLELPPVPSEAWRGYIRGKLSDRGIAIDDAAMDAILEYTGGHPYDTMQVAYEAYLAARRSRIVDGRLALAACASAQTSVAPLLDLEIQVAGPRARPLLSRIANGDPLFEGERSRDTVSRALMRLVRSGIVRRIAHGRYEINEPMLWRHLRRGGS